MTRTINASAVGLFLILAGLSTQTDLCRPESDELAKRKSQPAPLKLAIEVVRQTVCTIPEDSNQSSSERLGWANVDLRLTYTNSSNEPVLICKDCAMIAPQLYERLPNGRAGKVSYDPIYDRFDYPDPDELFGVQPDGSFMTLLPNQKYEMASGVGIPFHLGTARSALPQPGKYFLRVSVYFGWDFGRKAAKFRARWRRYGRLFTDSVDSSLVLLSIEKQPDMKDCPK